MSEDAETGGIVINATAVELTSSPQQTFYFVKMFPGNSKTAYLTFTIDLKPLIKSLEQYEAEQNKPPPVLIGPSFDLGEWKLEHHFTEGGILDLTYQTPWGYDIDSPDF